MVRARSHSEAQPSHLFGTDSLPFTQTNKPQAMHERTHTHTHTTTGRLHTYQLTQPRPRHKSIETRHGRQAGRQRPLRRAWGRRRARSRDPRRPVGRGAGSRQGRGHVRCRESGCKCGGLTDPCIMLHARKPCRASARSRGTSSTASGNEGGALVGPPSRPTCHASAYHRHTLPDICIHGPTATRASSNPS